MDQLISHLVRRIGAPKEELAASWVRRLCVVNGLLAFLQYIGQYREKNRFPTASGERKVAAFAVMNDKYVGFFRYTLFAHIASGMTAQLGSSMAIALEQQSPELSRQLARVAAAAESFVHAPTALILAPFVYGDKGIVPWLYGTVGALLQISGLSALAESGGVFGDADDGAMADGTRPELRRMCTTISIFLYVRLYAVMRGPSGFLRKQKYSLAVMTAGTAMMPVGWGRAVFPAVFWFLMAMNRKTAAATLASVQQRGIDATAKQMMKLA